VYGNLPLSSLTMQRGERVRWYLIGMGTEVDLHTPHWHGNTVLENGIRNDVVELLPASLKVADMVPDNPGTWLYHCHVNDHIEAGMLARFTVTP
jgi:hephaestin